MKTWTMPRVEIEAFRANEYVAGSCLDTLVSDEAFIRSIASNTDSFNVDTNGSEDGWDYPVVATSSSTLTQDEWDNRHFTDVRDVWVQIREDAVGTAESHNLTVEEQTLYSMIFIPVGTAYWVKVTGYKATGSGAALYHLASSSQVVHNHS